ncbi:MAG: EpsG family protein, partial [Paludibacteraceae bacterium]|nr:EpsG family protein [Paludibacteraceae bacterium]
MFNIICITISILCGLSFIELLYPNAKNLSNQLYQLAILITGFLVSIKYYFGPDIVIYVPMYENIKTLQELLFQPNTSDYEIGFLIYLSICKHWLGLSFWAMTTSITIIYFTTLHLLLRKLTSFKTFALFAIIFLQTNLIFFEFRQCLAVSFFIISILAIEKKQYVPLIIFSFLSIITHKSAIIIYAISLIGLILSYFKQDNNFFAISIFFLFAFILIPLKSLLLTASQILPFDTHVLKSIQEHLIIEERFQVVFLIYLIVSYSIYAYFYKSQKLKTWHIITICGLIVIAIFYQYWFFINRLRSYFIPIITFYAITICCNSPNKHLFTKQLTVFFVYCLFA